MKTNELNDKASLLRMFENLEIGVEEEKVTELIGIRFNKKK
jgi:hypothetical protein